MTRLLRAIYAALLADDLPLAGWLIRQGFRRLFVTCQPFVFRTVDSLWIRKLRVGLFYGRQVLWVRSTRRFRKAWARFVGYLLKSWVAVRGKITVRKGD